MRCYSHLKKCDLSQKFSPDFFQFLSQKSHNLTLPAWSTNGTTWEALRNMSRFEMAWRSDSPEKAKLTGGLSNLLHH